MNYKTCHIPMATMENDLNRLAKKGWEVIHITPISPVAFFVVFKQKSRPKNLLPEDCDINFDNLVRRAKRAKKNGRG